MGHHNEQALVYYASEADYRKRRAAHRSGAEEGCNPELARPHMESEARSYEREAGGPEGSLVRLVEEEPEARSAGHSGATVHRNEAHGCHSAGACCSYETLVVHSRHRRSRKAGGCTRGMAVCPGTQAGDCRTERLGELKTAAMVAAS